MRELKFRAFDTENKTWTFVTLGDLICGACTKNGDKPLSGAKQVWEQYTGLKDKNGNPIYEGDVVKGGWLYGKNWQVVKYQNYGFYPFIVTDFDGDSMVRNVDIEVIGNVHENTDLLEEEE